MTDQVAAADTTQTTTAAPATTAAPVTAVDPSTTAASTSLLGATETTAASEGTPPAATETTAAAKPDAPQGAPETYDFKGVDGASITESDVAAYAAVARELGLSQGDAQKVLDGIIPTIAERYAKASQDAVTTYRADLVAQVKADKEIGGDKLTENLAIADKAVTAYGSPELRKLFNESGLGDHPAVIRAFYKMGMDISNATFVPGGKQPSKGETDAASKLYGK